MNMRFALSVVISHSGFDRWGLFPRTIYPIGEFKVLCIRYRVDSMLAEISGLMLHISMWCWWVCKEEHVGKIHLLQNHPLRSWHNPWRCPIHGGTPKSSTHSTVTFPWWNQVKPTGFLLGSLLCSNIQPLHSTSPSCFSWASSSAVKSWAAAQDCRRGSVGIFLLFHGISLELMMIKLEKNQTFWGDWVFGKMFESTSLNMSISRKSQSGALCSKIVWTRKSSTKNAGGVHPIYIYIWIYN